MCPQPREKVSYRDTLYRGTVQFVSSETVEGILAAVLQEIGRET